MIKLINQSMSRKKAKFILLMIQFTIGFAALLFGISCIMNLYQYQNSIKELAPLDTVHAYIHDDSLEENSNSMHEYSKVFKQLKEKRLVEKLGLFELMYVYNSPQNSGDETQLYVLNNDIIELSNFTLQEGSIATLETDIGTTEDIPILVSAAMKNKYKMGMTYPLYFLNDNQQEYEEITVKVVGVLESSVHFWPGGSTFISENIVTNKEFILAPQFKEFEVNLTYSFNSLITLPTSESDENWEQIQHLFYQFGFDIQSTTLQEEVDAYYETQKVVIITTITFATILLILSLLGCIGAVLANITTRYNEFGIYYSLGFTKNDMIRLVYGEITVVVGVSFIIATVICKILFVTIMTDEELTMNLSVIAIAFTIMIVCIILSMIMPFIKLKRLEPIEMMKGVNR